MANNRMTVHNQKAVGFKRAHAACPGGRHGLSIDAVLNVASGKNAGYAGGGALAFRYQVSMRVRRDLAAKQRGIRRVSDRDEHAIDVDPASHPGLDVDQIQPRDRARIVYADNRLNSRVPDDLDFRILE